MAKQTRMTEDEDEAQTFVRGVLWPAVRNSCDGGLALYRAIVGDIFLDMGEVDATLDIEHVAELLALAREKAAEGERRGGGRGGAIEPITLESFDRFNPDRGADDPVRQAVMAVIARRPT
jgi:hypothetical protein